MSKKQQKNETPAPEEVLEQEQQTEQAPQGQDQEPEEAPAEDKSLEDTLRKLPLDELLQDIRDL